MSAESILLIASATFPVLGAVAVLIATSRHGVDASRISEGTTVADVPSTTTVRPDAGPGENSRLAFFLAILGFLGGTICAAILAFSLAGHSSPEMVISRVVLWDWLSFSVPHSPAIQFGLSTTWIKAAVVSLLGTLVMIAVGTAQFLKQRRFSDDALLTISVLNAAGVVFLFAPNTVQGFLAWSIASIAILILIRLSHIPGNVSNANLVKSNSSNNRPFDASQPNRFTGCMEACGRMAANFSGFVENWIRIPLSRVWANWCGEQVEVVSHCPASTQQAAAIFWASLILLTWVWAS